MKLRALFFTALLGAVSPGGLGPSLLAQNAGSNAKQNSSDTGNKSADQPAAAISGLTIARDNGTFLGLQIDENNNFKLSFYDAKKKPMAPDVASATLHWTPPGKRGIEFVSLTPDSDGKSLTSPRFIPKPWSFHLFIALFAEGSNDPVENYVKDFNQ